MTPKKIFVLQFFTQKKRCKSNQMNFDGDVFRHSVFQKSCKILFFTILILQQHQVAVEVVSAMVPTKHKLFSALFVKVDFEKDISNQNLKEFRYRDGITPNQMK